MADCYFCLRPATDTHHIFQGAYKKASERHNFMVYLCRDCHNKVHMDKAPRILLRQMCQQEYEKVFSRKELLVMDFDMMADKHPILIDLMGICACMTHASREGRQVALGYIKNILKRESIPMDGILPEFANVLSINYEGAEA